MGPRTWVGGEGSGASLHCNKREAAIKSTFHTPQTYVMLYVNYISIKLKKKKKGSCDYWVQAGDFMMGI